MLDKNRIRLKSQYHNQNFVVGKVGSAAAAFMSQSTSLFQTFLLTLEISSLSSELHTSDWLLHMFVFVVCFRPERPSLSTFDVRTVSDSKWGRQALVGVPADLSLIQCYWSLILSHGRKQNHN